MSLGNRIVLSADPKGKFVEGTLDAGITPKPGQVVQVKASSIGSSGLGGGGGNRDIWELYNADADGGNPKGPYIILIENYLLGRPMTVAYEASEHAFGYIPEHGDKLNLLIADVSGTGDDHTKGEILIIDDTTGKFIATTGSPEQEVAQLRETLTDPTADQLAYCEWQA